MTEPVDNPSRLADAIDAFLLRDTAAGESDTAYLARHSHVRDLLEPMLADAAPDAPQRVGPYRIVKELGRGGMGVVYEAEHAALRRVVALKILPSLFASWPRRVERFLREAVAVARLNHPGIVRVFDAGEADGVFYYAMERVDGGTLRDALDEVRRRCNGEPRRLADVPQFGLGDCRSRIDEIAALGVAVAEALVHAHAQGIVHRDIKPQNLLLDADRRPRVVDFGLVKDLDEPGMPSVEFAGTPHYASPEQIEPTGHGIDGRSDVFSLGVVLYELAALRRPFDGSSPQSVLRAVIGEEPRTLRSFDPRIPRDFEAILLQALEKTPSARYASADALAADLQRFRRGEPVRARRRSWWRRASRWVSRNPASATAMGLAFLLLVGGPSAAWWFSAQARAAIAAQRDTATASFKAARRAVEQLLVRIAAEDLPDAPRLQRFRLGLLQDAREGYEELLRIAGDSAESSLLREAIHTNSATASALSDLGRKVEAAALFTRSIALCQRVLARDPRNVNAQVELASALTGRGLAYHVTQRLENAARDFALAVNGWCELQQQLGPTDARQVSVHRGMAFTELRVADVLRSRDGVAAERALRRAHAAVAAIPHPVIDDLAIELQLATAGMAVARGDAAASAAAMQRCDDLLRDALARDSRSARLRSLGALLVDMRALTANSDAELTGAYLASLAAREVLVRDFPDVPAHRHSLAAAHDNFARALVRAGRLQEAKVHAETSLSMAAELTGEEGSIEARLRLAAAQMTFGVVGGHLAQDTDFADEMLEEACRALADLTREAPGDLRLHSELGTALSNRAQIHLMRRRDPAQAAELLTRAAGEQRVAVAGAPAVQAYRRHLANHLFLLIEASLRANDPAAAHGALREARTLVGEDADRLLTIAGGLARCAGLGVAGAGEDAVSALERIAKLGHQRRLQTLGTDRRFAALRDLPTFRALVEAARGAGR